MRRAANEPGDANGQASRDVWFTLTSAGDARAPSVQAPATGEPTIPLMAQLSLATSLVLLSTGALLIARRRLAFNRPVRVE